MQGELHPSTSRLGYSVRNDKKIPDFIVGDLIKTDYQRNLKDCVRNSLNVFL